jgi:hypothetical protein
MVMVLSAFCRSIRAVMSLSLVPALTYRNLY